MHPGLEQFGNERRPHSSAHLPLGREGVAKSRGEVFSKDWVSWREAKHSASVPS